MQEASGGGMPLTGSDLLGHALRVFDAAAVDVAAALTDLRDERGRRIGADADGGARSSGGVGRVDG